MQNDQSHSAKQDEKDLAQHLEPLIVTEQKPEVKSESLDDIILDIVNKTVEKAIEISRFSIMLNDAFDYLKNENVDEAVKLFKNIIENRLSRDYMPIYKDYEKEQIEHLKEVWHENLSGKKLENLSEEKIENSIEKKIENLYEKIKRLEHTLKSQKTDVDSQYVLEIILAYSYMLLGEKKVQKKNKSVCDEAEDENESENLNLNREGDEGYQEFKSAERYFKELTKKKNINILSGACHQWLMHIFGDVVGHRLSRYIANHHGKEYKDNLSLAMSIAERSISLHTDTEDDLISMRKYGVMLDHRKKEKDCKRSAHWLRHVILRCSELYPGALDDHAIHKFGHVAIHLSREKYKKDVAILDEALGYVKQLEESAKMATRYKEVANIKHLHAKLLLQQLIAIKKHKATEKLNMAKDSSLLFNEAMQCIEDAFSHQAQHEKNNVKRNDAQEAEDREKRFRIKNTKVGLLLFRNKIAEVNEIINDLSPSNLSNRDKRGMASIYLTRSKWYQKRKKFQEASEGFEKVLTLQNDHTYAQFLLVINQFDWAMNIYSRHDCVKAISFLKVAYNSANNYLKEARDEPNWRKSTLFYKMAECEWFYIENGDVAMDHLQEAIKLNLTNEDSDNEDSDDEDLDDEDSDNEYSGNEYSDDEDSDNEYSDDEYSKNKDAENLFNIITDELFTESNKNRRSKRPITEGKNSNRNTLFQSPSQHKSNTATTKPQPPNNSRQYKKRFK